jgi:hypothetical protein
VNHREHRGAQREEKREEEERRGEEREEFGLCSALCVPQCSLWFLSSALG